MHAFIEELKEHITKGIGKEELSRIKTKLTKKHGLANVPTDSELIMQGVALVSKPVRTLSGVAPLALMSMPFACPHGKCIYCPGGPGSAFGDVPQSYTGKEPSTLRGIRNHFDPYLIVFNRLEQFIVNGHLPQKTEIIVQGGTFPALPKQYQKEFITYALKAMNDFGEQFYENKNVSMSKFTSFFELPGKVGDTT